jgi:ABC-type branched-subunit amino acid transport system ATPase component/ABC-type branched-subunit amino acid transport system permease subunit
MRPSRVTGIVLSILVVGLSYFTGNVKLSILVGVAASAITALGLDVLVARTGELSLAHAAFLGVGAYTAINVGSRGAPWWVAIIVAVAVTAAAAAVAGLPSLRIRGLQVAITTLAFQVFAEQFLFTRRDVTAAGRELPRPEFLQSDVRLYTFALVALGIVLVARARLAATKGGRVFLAVRDIGERSRTFAIEPGPNKLLAYALSGAMVGLAGSVIAFKEGSISANDPFLLFESLLLVAIVVVGGAGSAAGIITAAVIIKGVPQFVSQFPGTSIDADRFMPMISAGLLVIAVVLAPQGIGGLYRWFGRLLDRGEERPDPAPHDVDAHVAAAHAEVLREVPRPLSLRMPVPALLVARDVTVEYGGVTALDRVSLEVRRGEIVGLIGANGAGKSTFFNAVSGLAPAWGSLKFRGVELFGRRASRRSALGIARTFQDLGLVRAESVVENVLLAQTWLARYPAAAGIVGLGGAVSTERELRSRAGLALELFGLEHLAHERLGDLPYGTMRMVEIAAAVAVGPDILLLDEATAGLGPDESHALGDRFVAVRDELGITLVVVEHHVPLIVRVCDYSYCLESGRLIAEGKPAAVVEEPQVVASFLGQADAASGGSERGPSGPARRAESGQV